ncbi:MAG: hypothetical protein ACLFP9_06785 [Desulfonatronovibrio sp.]
MLRVQRLKNKNSPESVKPGFGICQKGRKNSLQGGLNQNPGLARDELLLENLVYFSNQLRWLKDFD